MQIDTQSLTKWLHSHKGKDINQMPDGRMLPCKFVETLVEDCDELYNTLLEGCYLIPQNFIKN